MTLLARFTRGESGLRTMGLLLLGTAMVGCTTTTGSGDEVDGGNNGPDPAISYCGSDETSPQCAAAGDPGLVGEGGRFVASGQSSADIRAGYVDPSGNFMFVLVGDISIDNQSPTESTIWKVELPSGNRSVLSGTKILNPDTGLAEQMHETVGNGPSLGKAWGLDMGPDGQLYVHGQSGLFRVDPATGERTAITDYSFIEVGLDCPAQPATSGPGSRLAMGGTAQEPVAYVAFGKTTGAGILKFTGLVPGGTPVCSVVSSVGDGVSVPKVGSGPEWNSMSTPDELTRFGDKLFVSNFVNAAIYEVDPTDGTRSVVMKVDDPNQKGEGCFHYGRMAVGETTIWTTGGLHSSCFSQEGMRNLSSIDRATGNRELFTRSTGPLGRVPGALWFHPTLSNTLIVEDSDGILFVDTELKDSVFVAR